MSILILASRTDAKNPTFNLFSCSVEKKYLCWNLFRRLRQQIASKLIKVYAVHCLRMHQPRFTMLTVQSLFCNIEADNRKVEISLSVRSFKLSPSVYMSIFLSIFVHIYLSVHIYIYLCICLSVYLILFIAMYLSKLKKPVETCCQVASQNLSSRL